MTPLDLTQRPPRSPRAELDGIAFLPRAIDKCRAELPGGNLGSYINLDPEIVTWSSLFYRRMGITHDEFLAVVAAADSEDEIAAWLRERIDEAKLTKWHSQLLGTRLCDIPEALQGRVRERHPVAAAMPETTLMIDIFEADDAQLSGARPH
jgi:Domain of unknown function (DUF5069)